MLLYIKCGRIFRRSMTCPSDLCRTGSSRVTDWESEAVGLAVRSNRTESEPFMRRKLAIRWRRSEGQVHDRSYRANHATCPSDRTCFRGIFRFLGLTSLGGPKNLCRKGLERVRLEALTSLQPHLNLTSTSLNILRYKGNV